MRHECDHRDLINVVPEGREAHVLRPHPRSSSQITRQSWVCQIVLFTIGPFLLPVKPNAKQPPSISLGILLCLLRPYGSVCLREGVPLCRNYAVSTYTDGVMTQKVLSGTSVPGRQCVSPSVSGLSRAGEVWLWGLYIGPL